MNILMVNGSPHREGCTARALHEVEKEFKILGDNGKLKTNKHIYKYKKIY